MPIYEYVCMTCESHFEELVRHDEVPPCPECGSTKSKKQFSVFAMHGASQTHGASQQPSFGSSSGGGCCGGSCGCGGH